MVQLPPVGFWIHSNANKILGAMENWGLITYRTTAVLFDEQQSDAKYKNRVVYVVAHGMTHPSPQPGRLS